MASAQRSSTKSMLPARRFAFTARGSIASDASMAVARAGVVARVEQHAGERREDAARRAAGRHARGDTRCGRAGEIALAACARRRDRACRSAKRSAPMAAGAFGIGGRMRLLERMFGLPQLGRVRVATRRSGSRVSAAARARDRAAG